MCEAVRNFAMSLTQMCSINFLIQPGNMIFKNENSKKVCNSGNSPQKLQIKSTMLQIVLLVFPENITQSHSLSPQLLAFIPLRLGPKPSQAVTRARLSSA